MCLFVTHQSPKRFGPEPCEIVVCCGDPARDGLFSSFCSIVLGRCGEGRLVTKLQRYVINQLWDSHIKAGSLIRDLEKLDYKNGSRSIVPKVPWGEEEVLAQLFHAPTSWMGRTGRLKECMLLKSEVRWGVFFSLWQKQVYCVPLDQDEEQYCLHHMGFGAGKFCKIYIANW